MKLIDLQTHLKKQRLYEGRLDGLDGPKTQGAINLFLGKAQVANFTLWPAKRKIVAAEQLIYHTLGMPVGKIDGLVGTQTLWCRESYDYFIEHGKMPLFGDRDGDGIPDAQQKPAVSTAPPPSKSPTAPAIIKPENYVPLQSEVEKFYGAPGTNHTKIELPFPMYLAWDKGEVVNKFAVHEKVHDPMLRALKKIEAAYSPAQIAEHGFNLFGGCFNDRNMRGGTKKSMHAYACAIDLDPERNQLKWSRNGTAAKKFLDKAYFARSECAELVRIWQSEGFVSLGAARDFDWMHFQYARLG